MAPYSTDASKKVIEFNIFEHTPTNVATIRQMVAGFLFHSLIFRKNLTKELTCLQFSYHFLS